jgi:Tol biopolymer transport system component/DNA-binding winged helix-turn-helix (wHTH) protein
MSQISTRLYEFGGFRLDASERVLWRGEEMIVLPSKVFDTLWMLVKEEGRVVSKSELMEAIWTDAFVEESNVSQNIYTLRRTLGVDEQGRQFIETIPRRGYRFAVPVKLLDEASNNGVSANDSQAFAAAQTPPVSPSPPAEKALRPRLALRYALFAGLGILILSSLGFGVYQFINRRGEKEKIAPIEQVRFQRLTDSGDVVFPTISPDGELLAYVRLEEEQGSVWVKQIATGSTFQILPPTRKSYRSLSFSPDGQYLFFRDDVGPGAIYQTSAFGGASKKVADNVWSDFSISPDGKQLAFVRRDAGRDSHSLIVSNIEGGAARELIEKQLSLNEGGVAPAWSPDGAKLILIARSQQQDLPALLIFDRVTGKETEMKTQRWRAISRVLWTPNGKHLIFSARATNESYSQVWMLDYPDGAVRRLTNDLESYFWLSLSADGRRLVTRQQRIVSHLWLLAGADVKKARQLTIGGRNLDGFVGLAWTPDSKIVFSAFANNVTELYLMNPDGSNRVPLTANAGPDNNFPVVSRDGRHIVFTSNRTSARQIWRMDIDGRDQKQLTFGEGKKDSAHYAALSSDGAKVFFIKHGAGPAAIWKVSIEGGTPVPVSRLTGATTDGFLSISPDGKWLAYHHVSAQPEPRGEERTLRIGVLPTSGGDQPQLFDLPMRLPITQWSADSTAFDYIAGTFNSSSLWRQPLNGGGAQKLCDFPDRVFNFAWSSDRKNLVVSRGKQQGDALLITNLP